MKGKDQNSIIKLYSVHKYNKDKGRISQVAVVAQLQDSDKLNTRRNVTTQALKPWSNKDQQFKKAKTYYDGKQSPDNPNPTAW